MSALRVLVVGPAPASATSRGGMATVMSQLLDHPDPGVSIRVVATYVDAPPLRRLAVGVAGMIRAAALVLAGRADVLHVHLAHGGSVVRKAVPLLAARLTGVATVVHAHSYDFPGWFDRLPPALRRLVVAALRADHWLVLGERLREDYRGRLRLPSQRISVLHNAAPLPEPRPAPRRTGAQLHLVSLGRLGARKGSYDLVAAVAALPGSVRARLRVSLAGDGDVERVAAAAATAGVGETVSVLGWVGASERHRLLCDADLFALPSYEEGLPMALLEAMTYGLAPVTTPVGSIAEVVRDGVDGLLVPPGDRAALTAALQRLVTDDALRRRLGAAAADRAGDFGLTAWYRRLSALWQELVARERQPASS
ncbi:glycosyltransferase family 4 protein [Mycobacterium sp. MYCO198283]|uniref:glycosyltransferase family 4 protein n=1 Tax=Mycobacterium sp. MYCO198283 TaxID=2883505 RepID=UPI001E50B79F|nr:glycosyltransferase family 4 protein [Mycobacterium sp. MYCO198283]MCG5433888.1 glycosyltransferase family 4 protein [Mycobacterium sp. MYCO198283]